MRKKPVKGKYSNQRNAPDLDCCVCIHRRECDRAQEGSFCSQFRSKEFVPQGEDPNDLWRRGEEVEF